MPRNLVTFAFVMLCLGGGLYAQVASSIVIDEDLQLVKIHDSVFLHRSWEEVEGFGRVSANGLVVIEKGHAALVDTPWNNERTKKLVLFLKDSMEVDVKLAFVGHFHNDCVGGLGYLNQHQVKTIGNVQTAGLCKAEGIPSPTQLFHDSLVLELNGMSIVASFHGGGHAPDNIVVWLPRYRLLFGGCMVRSSATHSLGNTEDAVMDEWSSTVEKVLQAYDAITVVPGHGQPGGEELLTHTIQLVKEANADDQ